MTLMICFFSVGEVVGWIERLGALVGDGVEEPIGALDMLGLDVVVIP